LSSSPPIISDYSRNDFAERIRFGVTEIRFFVFCENRQGNYRHVFSAEQIDNPGSAALAAPAEA